MPAFQELSGKQETGHQDFHRAETRHRMNLRCQRSAAFPGKTMRVTSMVTHDVWKCTPTLTAHPSAPKRPAPQTTAELAQHHPARACQSCNPTLSAESQPILHITPHCPGGRHPIPLGAGTPADILISSSSSNSKNTIRTMMIKKNLNH